MSDAKFSLGRVVITPAALDDLDPEDVYLSLARHERCDWGDVCPEDQDTNDQALTSGGRLFSVYRDRDNVKFWIITEADRSATTVLLPGDY